VERLAGESEGNAVSAKQPQAEQASALDARIFSDLELLPPNQTLRHMSNHSSKGKFAQLHPYFCESCTHQLYLSHTVMAAKRL